jgi:superfamily II RNA helicase
LKYKKLKNNYLKKEEFNMTRNYRKNTVYTKPIKKCNLIKHNKRPVPLSHYIFVPQTMQNHNNSFLDSELMCFLEDKTWNEGVFNKASNN